MTDIRIIEVAGSSYEMGFQYGSSCRELIKGFIGAHYKVLLYCSAEKAKTFLQEHDVRKLARQYIPFAGGGLYCDEFTEFTLDPSNVRLKRGWGLII